MTNQEENKVVSLKAKHALIMERFAELEEAFTGREKYKDPIYFWEDLHNLNDLIKDFLTHYFKGSSSIERFKNSNLYTDIVTIHMKITLQ